MTVSATALRLQREHVERRSRFKRAAIGGLFKRFEEDRDRRVRVASQRGLSPREKYEVYLDKLKADATSTIYSSDSGSALGRARAVIRFVSRKMGVAEKDILGRSRLASVYDARHVAVYLIRKLVPMGAMAAGRFFGRDHSTIRHSTRVVLGSMESDEGFRNEIESWIADLHGSAEFR